MQQQLQAPQLQQTPQLQHQHQALQLQHQHQAPQLSQPHQALLPQCLHLQVLQLFHPPLCLQLHHLQSLPVQACPALWPHQGLHQAPLVHLPRDRQSQAVHRHQPPLAHLPPVPRFHQVHQGRPALLLLSLHQVLLALLVLPALLLLWLHQYQALLALLVPLPHLHQCHQPQTAKPLPDLLQHQHQDLQSPPALALALGPHPLQPQLAPLAPPMCVMARSRHHKGLLLQQLHHLHPFLPQLLLQVSPPSLLVPSLMLTHS